VGVEWIPALSRLERDFMSNGAVLRWDGTECVAGAALAGGPWGIAVALAELARRTKSASRLRAAQRLIEAPSTLEGQGLFTGLDGKRCAEAALRRCAVSSGGGSAARATVAWDSPSMSGPGDLIDGQLGMIWARRCLGAMDRLADRKFDQGHWDGKNAGLAHGELGLLACEAPWLSEYTAMKGIERCASTASPAWCNGMAGAAVTALMAAPSPSSPLASLAKSYARAALGQLPLLESDALCHGTSGVLVACAGVARCAKDDLLATQVTRAVERYLRRPTGFQVRLDKGFLIDQSWLTGIAGIAWAMMAIQAAPLINPLCPPDSVLARSRGWGDGGTQTDSRVG
jgi:hypothetical protein